MQKGRTRDLENRADCQGTDRHCPHSYDPEHREVAKCCPGGQLCHFVVPDTLYRQAPTLQQEHLPRIDCSHHNYRLSGQVPSRLHGATNLFHEAEFALTEEFELTDLARDDPTVWLRKRLENGL